MEVLSLDEAIGQFSTQITIGSTKVRRKTQRTVAHYRDVLTRLAAAMPSGLILLDLTENTLARHFEGRKVQEITLKNEMSVISSFCNWAVRARLLDRSPMAGLQRPQPEAPLPIYLEEHEIRKLLSAPDCDTWAGRRDQTALVVLANTGLRVSELVGLDVDHLNLARQEMQVMGKGQRPALVTLNGPCLRTLEAWLAIRGEADTQALFSNYDGARASVGWAQKMIKEYGRPLGIDEKKLTPHKCRHSFGTLLHFRGVDIIEIQAAMRHRSIVSTQRYTHFRQEAVRNAVNLLDLDGANGAKIQEVRAVSEKWSG